MGRRGRKAEAIAASGEPTEAREALERRWRDRMIVEPRLATLVTAEGGRREPFHRWIPYKQGFSPGLVRQFLSENPRTLKKWASHPLLDPFCGSGTCIVECARHGVSAMGIEALDSLVFLTKVKFEREFPAFPDFSGASTWQEMADQLESRVHRAALMLAVGRRHTTDGRANRGAKPLNILIGEVSAMMRDDLAHPLNQVNRIEIGDARSLATIEDGAIGGILTSPPYLSRYDYSRISSPYDTVYAHWYGENGGVEQVRAASRGWLKCTEVKGERAESTTSPSRIPPSPYISITDEVSEWLTRNGQARLAGVVRGYMEDLAMVMQECHRVLTLNGACWMVVGGARVKDAYVPADLMAAEIAEACGFQVERIRVARDLVGSPRKFGRLGHVAPRETLLVLQNQ